MSGETRVTFAEFDARINRLANALLDLGLAENARVAVLIENRRNDFLNEDHVIDENDVFVNVAPLTHAARNHVHKYYVKGATNIVLDRFDPEIVLATIEREQAMGVMLVPTMLVRLLRCDRLDAFDCSSPTSATPGATGGPTRASGAARWISDAMPTRFGACASPA